MTREKKIGLALALFLGLVDIAFTFIPTPGDTEDASPPFFIVIRGLVVGILTVVGAAIVWRSGNRAAFWMVIVTRVISALSGIPAFIFGAPVLIQGVIVVTTVLTIICLVLLLRPSRESAAVQT